MLSSISRNIDIETFITEDNDLDVGALFAQELNALSLQERNTLFERIHGVESLEVETEEMLNRKLQELNHALDEIDHKPAYNKALCQDNTYVKSRKFQLMFLRADSFNVKQAAKKIVGFMEEKLQRFGSKALARSLTLNDLSVPARSLLAKKGVIQLLPARDRVGRAVLLCYHHFSNYRAELKQDSQALADAALYVLLAAGEDEETQKRGIVTLIVIDSFPSWSDLDYLRRHIEGTEHLNSVLPFKYPANHVWFSEVSPLVKNVFGMITAGMGKQFLLQTKLHTGSYEETKYALMTYGIPVEYLPFSLDGRELCLTANQKWLRRRPAKEAEMRANFEFEGIDVPGCHDVCLQRGTSFHHHQGNLFMRSQMEILEKEYQSATSSDRKVLSKKVMQEVHKQGGRFLSKKPGGWFEEIKEEAEIIKIIGTSFRSMLARHAKQVQAEDPQKVNAFLEMNGAKRLRVDNLCLPSSLRSSEGKRSFHDFPENHNT